MLDRGCSRSHRERAAMHSCQKLLDGNKAFVTGMLAQDPDYFNKLAHGQKPKYLWIGCADSRVPADRITGTNPGEIFVHRNVANLVVHTDINMLSVVTYAVEHLEVEDIIVCGHYGCGGVQASLSANSFGLLDNWLRNIKDVYRLYERELDRLAPEKRLRRLVELNVMEQVYNLCKTSCVQEAWKKRELKVHGWVYDVADGLIQDLQVNFASAKDLDAVYRFEPALKSD